MPDEPVGEEGNADEVIRTRAGRETEPGTLNCDDYTPGKVTPWGKVLELLQFSTSPNFVVYMVEESFGVVYEGEWDDSAVEHLRRADLLQALPDSHLPAEQRRAFREMIGYGIVAALEQAPETATKILTQAEQFLKSRNEEASRRFHLLGSTPLFLLFVFLAIRNLPGGTELAKQAFTIMGCGALGAYLSILSRLSQVSSDPAAGKLMHIIDGAIRVIVGVLGALIVAIAVKTKAIFGFVAPASDSTIDVMFLFCIVAGASERMVPTLIASLERQAEKKHEDAGGNANDDAEDDEE